MTGAGVVTNLTHATVGSGSEDAAVNLGYGGGFYGQGYYGTTRPTTGSYSEASTWSLDNFGEDLVAVPRWP